MSTTSKIISFDQIPAIVSKEKECGNKIVQCHGTFDLIHPGHVIHFEESKGMGDTLIVTITGEKFVNKGPGARISMTNCGSSPLPLLNPSIMLQSYPTQPPSKQLKP